MANDSTRSRKHSRTGPRAADARDRQGPDDSPLARARHNFAEATRIVSLRRWAFLVPFCLVSTLAAWLSYRIPRLYEVTTSFERRENPVLRNLPDGSSIRIVKDSRATMTRDLGSLALIEDVLDDLGLTRDFPRDPEGRLTPQGEAQRRALAARYAAGVEVTFSPQNAEAPLETITLCCEGHDPTHLPQVCNRLRELYIRRTRATMTEQLADTKRYFEEQVRRCEDTIQTLNQRRLRGDLDSYEIDWSQPHSIVNRMAALEGERESLSREQSELQSRLAAHRDYLQEIRHRAARSAQANQGAFLAGFGSPAGSPAAQLRADIHDLDAEIVNERNVNGKTERHPDVIALHRQRELLVARLEELQRRDGQAAANRGLGAASSPDDDAVLSDVWLVQISQVEMEINNLTGQLQQNERALAATQKKLANLTERKSEVYQRFQDRESVSDSLLAAKADHATYRQTVSKLEALLTADENERAVGFTVIRPARPTLIPSRPRAHIVLVLCLLLGVVAGACGVLLSEILDHSYHTTRQVARSLGLTVLECVDEIVTAADRARQFRRKVLIAPALAALLLAITLGSNALAYLSLHHPDTYNRVRALPRTAWDQVAGSAHHGDSVRTAQAAPGSDA
jgi:hypothetical protein